MCRSLTFGSFLCWTSVTLCYTSVALNSNVSSYDHFENETDGVHEKEDAEWDPSFVHLRNRLPLHLQPIRPYTLRTSEEDDHDTPKPKPHRPSRLLRLLGSSFDPFWMSVDEPPEASRGRQPLLLHGKHNATSPPALREAAENLRRKLEKEAAELNLDPLPADVARAVRSWLVRSAACDLQQQWVDLGAAFWPRWLRQTDCQGSDGGQRCSFPPGMECVRAQTTQIKILAWHCVEARAGGDGSGRIRGERSDFDDEAETIHKCLWRKVSHPVVTACRCSCQ
uniref:Noggin n=2 Tax=Salarias fasciatus TaxID=181472 RepID=A0A672FGI4_SALFA